MNKQHWRIVIVFGGGCLSLIFAVISLALMAYNAHVSGSWIECDGCKSYYEMIVKVGPQNERS